MKKLLLVFIVISNMLFSSTGQEWIFTTREPVSNPTANPLVYLLIYLFIYLLFYFQGLY